MNGAYPDDVTRLLAAAAGGESGAAAALLPLVYDELRRLAAAYFREERANHTLEPTALVHEAYVKLVDQTSIKWRSRGQFYVVAAKAMRNILVDHARGRNRQKRGGGWDRIGLEVAGAETPEESRIDLVALDEALGRLSEVDERKARLVELRFFAGLTSEQAADILGISRTTAAMEWRMTRAWLYRELGDDDDGC